MHPTWTSNNRSNGSKLQTISTPAKDPTTPCLTPTSPMGKDMEEVLVAVDSTMDEEAEEDGYK